MTFLLCLFLALFTSYSFAQSNLLRNPGFEEWEDILEGWEVGNGEPNAISRSSESYSGNYAVKISHKEKKSYSWVRQAVDVEPYTSYDAYVVLRGENIQRDIGAAGARLLLGEYPVANGIGASAEMDGTFEWVKMYSNRLNTGPRTKIWFYVYLHKSSGTLWIDDVMLTIADDSLRDLASRKRNRVLADLKTVERNIKLLEEKQGATATTSLRTELASLESQINEYKFEEDFDYTQSPPYNNLHSSVYKLNSKVLSRFYQGEEFLIWSDGKWSPLSPLQLPTNTDKLCLREDLMLNEWGSSAFNITNINPEPLSVTVSLSNFSDGTSTFSLDRFTIRQVVFVESVSGRLQPDALRKAERVDGDKYLITIPPGSTIQVWIQINGKGFAKAGTYDGTILVNSDKNADKAYLTVGFWPVSFPEETTLYTYNWSYLLWPTLVGREKEAVQDLFAHYTNTFVILYTYLPKPSFDKDGNIIAMDFSKFDQQLDYHKGAKMYLLWPGFAAPYNRSLWSWSLEFMSPQWEKAFEEWVRAVVNHLEERGIKKNQFAFYPVDEPGYTPGKPLSVHQIHVETAKKIKEIDPDLLVYANPIGQINEEGLEQIAQVTDILCPDLKQLVIEEDRNALTQTGRTIWTYQCNGPGKDLSPIGYYRLQSWGAWLTGARGSGFWTYVGGGGNVWDDLSEKRSTYAIIYGSEEELVPSKRWEAWREGIEDYEYLVMLENELEKYKDNTDEVVKSGQEFLQQTPQRVFKESNPQVIDEARTTILRLLVELQSINK